MTAETIHTCSYSCERPECIRAQRDELAARLTAETSNARGWVLMPREVVDFLMGEGELQGAWFGETPPGERGQWFWRKHLRHAKDAALAAEGVQAGEVSAYDLAVLDDAAETLDRLGDGSTGLRAARARIASALSQQPDPKAEARGVTRQLLHWGGVPVHVTGTVTTSPGNWSLIDADLTGERNG